MEAGDLIREVNRLFNQGDTPDDFTLHRLTTEAGRLGNEQSAVGLLVQARLACLAGRVEAMRAFHIQLLNHAPDHPKVHLDYALSLRKLGFYTEARERSRTALELDSGHSGAVQSLIRDTVASGRIHEASELARKAMESFPMTRRQFAFVNEAARFLSDHDIEDDALEALPTLAMALLHADDRFPYGSLRCPAVQLHLDTGTADPRINPSTGRPMEGMRLEGLPVDGLGLDCGVPDVGGGVILPGEDTNRGAAAGLRTGLSPDNGLYDGYRLHWRIQLADDDETVDLWNERLGKALLDSEIDLELLRTVALRFISRRGGVHGAQVFFA
ncbi:MAG: tetratricopeptide repeat protein [Magnetococcales bacterium]|nr:tetratricopeptide repeat protein [Magnetococcales bacterium]